MLRAGVGKVEITAPIGARMAGFANKAFPAIAVHDPLWARALVFDDGERRIGMVACDLIGVSEEQVAAVRREAASAAGLSSEALLVAGTHTHSGPARHGDDSTDLERAYWESVPGKVAEAVAAASANLTPVKLGAASGWSAVGMNRRQFLPRGQMVMGPGEFGVFDTELAVVRIERAEGGPLACLFNYACHAVCLMSDNYLISADYPGFARHHFEREIGDGVTAIFFNGCCGDINPREISRGPGDLPGCLLTASHSGVRIAGEAVRVWRKVIPSEGGALAYARRRISLPVNPERAIRAAEAHLRDNERRAEHEAQEELTPYTVSWYPPNVEGARKHLARVKETAHLPIECEIQALQVGELTFVGWPGEIFCELGMELKQRSPFRPTYVFSNANGSIGYVPTPEAFSQGGYEAEMAAGKTDHAGTVLVEETLALLEALKR